MDPLRIAARVAFAYFFALVLVRVAGKREVKHADLASFVLSVIIGDLFDDALWAEVSMAEFVVASGVLSLAHVLVSLDEYYRGARIWRRAWHQPGGGR